MRKRFKKSAKKVKDLVPDNVSELNPLAKKEEPTPSLPVNIFIRFSIPNTALSSLHL
jgi:hypothetical protein